MSYHLEITDRAKKDRNECFDYIYARSPEGALRWLEAFEAAAAALLTRPHMGEAPESEGHETAIRQKFFRTAHGRTYRLLYTICDDVIYIIHVRGAGQDLLGADEVDLPAAR